MDWIATYGSATLISAVSVVLGQTALTTAGYPRFSWVSAPVGLAALLVLAGLAVRLPGHGTTAAAIVVACTVAGALYLRRRVGGLRPALRQGVPAALLCGLLASLPFIASGHIGVLGVGLVNDDMASHLLMADWLDSHLGTTPMLIRQGYPLGPHSLAATVSSGLGTGLIEAFAGLILALPILTGLVAVEALARVRPLLRLAAAVLVALPYLISAYLAQQAFKELTMALLVIGFALLLPWATTARRAGPLGVLAAGAVFTYSFPGLFWLAGTALIYWAAARRTGRAPRLAPISLSVAAIVVALTLPDWGHILDFAGFKSFNPGAHGGSGVGNLGGQLSPLEALGVWPTSEFRLAAGAGSLPAIAFYCGAALGALALAVGLPRWIRRDGAALPGALAAAAAIYIGARAFGTVYTAGKALAIAAPLVMLLSLGGLLLSGTQGRRRGVRGLLALALMLAAAFSSFLVLRQAPVGPLTHMQELDAIRPLVQDQDVLFLGRDNFVSYELRGTRPFTAVRNYYDPYYVTPNLRLHDVFSKFDFDSVTDHTLRRFDYVITTRAAFASGPPPSYRPVLETDDYVLWRRSGPVGPRDTLQEGDRPGTTLECSGKRGRELERSGGTATAVSPRPVVGEETAWAATSTVEDGGRATQTLSLPAGRWELSLQYDATRPVTVTAEGLDASLPANLDYRGPAPFWPVGELDARAGRKLQVSVSVEDPPPLGRLMGASSVAHLGAVAASPAGHDGAGPGAGERSLSLDRACEAYVDWYRAR